MDLRRQRTAGTSQAEEAHALLDSLPHAHEHIFYSQATAAERRRAGAADGRLSSKKLAALAVPVDATAYICGPASFMNDVRDALASLGIDQSRIRTELFGALSAINPGLTGQARKQPHQPPGPPGTGPQVTFARSGIAVPFPGRAAQRAGPRRRVRCPPPAGAAGRGYVTPASHRSSPATSPTRPTRSNRRLTGTFSSAAPGPAPTSSWTCDGIEPSKHAIRAARSPA